MSRLWTARADREPRDSSGCHCQERSDDAIPRNGRSIVLFGDKPKMARTRGREDKNWHRSSSAVRQSICSVCRAACAMTMRGFCATGVTRSSPTVRFFAATRPPAISISSIYRGRCRRRPRALSPKTRSPSTGSSRVTRSATGTARSQRASRPRRRAPVCRAFSFTGSASRGSPNSATRSSPPTARICSRRTRAIACRAVI